MPGELDKTAIMASSTEDQSMVTTKSDYSSPNSLDDQLRAAEMSLQGDEASLLEAMPISDTVNASIGNIDKIRDILFGTNMRDYEKRFKRFEDRLSKARSALREELLQRIKAVEDMVVSETEQLTEKVKLDRQERYESHQDVIHELKTLKNELNNRISQVDDQISKDIKQMRQQHHTKIQELTTQLRQQSESVMALLKQEVQQLNEEKVGRSDLASFFTEFALRLNKDFNAPVTNEIDYD